MRREEVTYVCDGCAVERVADRIDLGNGNRKFALPAGWMRLEGGIAQPQPSGIFNIKGEFCSVECLTDWLVEGGIAHRHKEGR